MNKFLLDELFKDIVVDTWGMCNIDKVEKILHKSIPPKTFKTVVIFGIKLQEAVLETITETPSLLYKHHYKVLNWILDQTSFRLAQRIEKLGYKALAIPASQEVDWENQLGHLSHKLVGLHAGLGWIGKSGLLIHPRFGPRVRYTTVLTNMVLKSTANIPMESQCGECKLCIEACPAGAISETGYDWKTCFTQLKRFAATRGIGQFICGICIKVCPVGKPLKTTDNRHQTIDF